MPPAEVANVKLVAPEGTWLICLYWDLPPPNLIAWSGFIQRETSAHTNPSLPGRKWSHWLIGSNESPIWLGGLGRPIWSAAVGFWPQHRTLFPRQKVDGNRERSLGRLWPTFENQDPYAEPALVPSCTAEPDRIVAILGWGLHNAKRRAEDQVVSSSPLPESQSIPSPWQQGQGKEQPPLSHSCLCWWPCSSDFPGYIISTHPDLSVTVAHHTPPRTSEEDFLFCSLLLWC